MGKEVLEKHRKNWFWKASLGLMFTGAGLCIFGEALHWKYVPDAPWWKWIAWGSLSMVVFHTGLCMVVSAAIHRSHYERLQEKSEANGK